MSPSPPHLSWVPGSLPKLIVPIFPPSSLPGSPISLLGWDLPKQLQTPLPCPALTLKAPHRVLSLPGQLQLIAWSWMLVCPRRVSPNASRKLTGPQGLWPESTHDTNTTERTWSLSLSLGPFALLPPRGTDHPGPQTDSREEPLLRGSRLGGFTREDPVRGLIPTSTGS